MLIFLLFAVVINALPAVLFVLLRERVAQWPLPGLWWLALGTLAVILTLALAKHSL